MKAARAWVFTFWSTHNNRMFPHLF